MQQEATSGSCWFAFFLVKVPGGAASEKLQGIAETILFRSLYFKFNTANAAPSFLISISMVLRERPKWKDNKFAH